MILSQRSTDQGDPGGHRNRAHLAGRWVGIGGFAEWGKDKSEDKSYCKRVWAGGFPFGEE